MNYNVRIDENFLKADHQDGEVLQHNDLNELENVVKTAINANYEDIQKLQDGTISISTASSLSANEGTATLSQYSTETLQASDSKIPTGLQVKSYVDNLYNSSNLGLVYYWDGTSSQASVNLFNTLCNKYDNNEQFVLFGKFNVRFSFTNANDEIYTVNKQVVSPIIVNKMIGYESTGTSDTAFSFVTPPIIYWDNRYSEWPKYAIGAVSLTGTWGQFTAVSAGTNYATPYLAPVSTSVFQDAIDYLQAQIDELRG